MANKAGHDEKDLKSDYVRDSRSYNPNDELYSGRVQDHVEAKPSVHGDRYQALKIDM